MEYVKEECIIFGHLDCMKDGCCRKCKQYKTCESNLRCDNDPAKCGVYKKFEIDMRKLLEDW